MQTGKIATTIRHKCAAHQNAQVCVQKRTALQSSDPSEERCGAESWEHDGEAEQRDLAQGSDAVEHSRATESDAFCWAMCAYSDTVPSWPLSHVLYRPFPDVNALADGRCCRQRRYQATTRAP
eukprot:6209119-Prymnesium_polylepis.1